MGDKLLTIASFFDVTEAHIARGKLEATGIDSVLADDAMVGLNWFYANALGGVKVQVLEEDAQRARDVLSAEIPERFDADEVGDDFEQPRCPKCGSLDVRETSDMEHARITVLAVLYVPLPAGQRYWKCAECGAAWFDDEEDEEQGK